MKTRYETAEIRRSIARGAGDFWSVQDVAVNGEWLLFELEERRIYAPLEHLELPNQFAKVTDERAALSFVRQFGRLGWRNLVLTSVARDTDPWLQWMLQRQANEIHGRGQLYAEPLEWILAHARAVRWCLDASVALREEPLKRRESCDALATKIGELQAVRETIQPQRDLRRTVGSLQSTVVIGALLAEHLQVNVRGVRRRISFDKSRTAIDSRWGGDSLLESIYTLVADTVSGGKLARCQAEGCGAVFIQTDERQRFCPPREGQSKSPCMNRERVQRYRNKVRKRKGKRNGKATRSRRG